MFYFFEKLHQREIIRLIGESLLSFAFDWLRERREFSEPITERSRTKLKQPKITCSTLLKIALRPFFLKVYLTIPHK